MDAHDIIIERVATPGPTEAFTEMIVELIRERTDGAEVRRLGREPLLGSACDGKPCAIDCCVPAKRPAHAGRPA